MCSIIPGACRIYEITLFLPPRRIKLIFFSDMFVRTKPKRGAQGREGTIENSFISSLFK